MPQIRPPIEQVLPKADAFTEETSSYGNYPTTYIAAAMWTAKTIAHPVTLSYSSTINASDLVDIFSEPGDWNKAATPATNRSGFILRAPYSNADQKIELGWKVRVLAGNGHNTNRFTDVCFVGARITGGTYASASHTLTDVQAGYFFGFLSASGLEGTWYLLRLNAGAITVLASSTFNGAAPGTGAALSLLLNPKRTNRITLDVTASGGDVRLVGKLIKPDDAGGTTSTTIVDFTDTSGSKLTAAGRCGFIINGQVTAAGSPGGGVANLVSLFRVTDAGVIVHCDTFERVWRAAGKAASATVSSVTYSGNSLMSAWVGDHSTIVAYDRKLQRCAIAGLTNRIMVDPNTEPVGSSTIVGAGGFLLAQRPATDPVSSNRTLRVRFSSLKADGTAGTTNATPHRAAGICVRIAGGGVPSATWMPDAGYALIAFREDVAPTTKLELYRYQEGVAVLIGSSDPYTFALDTDYDLTLEVHNELDGAGRAEGAVLLSAYVGGVQVVLDTEHASVMVDASGTIVDGSSRRVLRGRGEGIYAYAPGGNKVVVLDAWAEGTLTNGTASTEVDQASVAVTAEDAGFVGDTFTTPLRAAVEQSVTRRRATIEMESGHRYRGAIDRAARRSWRVTAALDDAQRDALLAFFEAHDGARLGFYWTPPAPAAQTALRVHFVDEDLPRNVRGVGLTTVSFELEELLG